ncbi:GNAT family N-acetyltransferase [Permianibacter sp. IMCC34836]|uniref:GNAT family N-acetyltransferase n=1 Tax=Permianibacter fluminis TaxID=2738515 RepID=UPI001551B06E|nr:GNAT family N-acetyltransferase [Permianibacter fluminis]NQD38234.1 GNAT family N-acetyltransferase [Permianibacter fluminis]
MQTLKTTRLLLRQWRPEDAKPFAELNADPEVMQHFPARLTAAESDAMLTRCQQHIEVHGWGLWAVEQIDGGDFIGFVGLSRPRFQAAFTPCVEVGWRLRRSAWGHGFASEAATACLHFGFDTLQLDEIVSFTAASNTRSQCVMQRLGMRHNPADNFLHPLLDPQHPITPHVLYRIAQAEWRKNLTR